MTCREMQEKALQEGHEAEAPSTDLDFDSQSNPDSEPEEDEHLPSPLDGALTAQASIHTHTAEMQKGCHPLLEWISAQCKNLPCMCDTRKLHYRQCRLSEAIKAGAVQHPPKGLLVI